MDNASRRRRAFGALMYGTTVITAFGVAAAAAQQPASIAARVPFTMTLSNNTPLAFGMDGDTTARALGTPLYYVSGRPGDEVLLAFRTQGGSGLLPRRDRLYLQFRDGRLTGWKGDWGRNWMWR
jgi:hypothetical protein